MGTQHTDTDRDTAVRAPAVAGQFYPGDAEKLSAALEAFFRDAEPAGSERPLAVVVPHAGYIFSGQITADAYNQARPFTYRTIVILGTNHTKAGFRNVGIYPGAGMRTPLGTLAVDQALAEQLIASCEDCIYRAAVHEKEHSVEVQLPFIQYAFPGIDILPVVVGTAEEAMCLRFGESLGRLLQDRDALIVASSDLSHYPAYEAAGPVDRDTLRSLESLNPRVFHQAVNAPPEPPVSNLYTRACGEGPILAAMAAARELGATAAIPVSYANSGDVLIGDRDRVVGYGAVVFAAAQRKAADETEALAEPAPAPAPGPLSPDHRRSLLAFARKTIHQFLTSDTVPVPRGFDPVLWGNQGAFVTLRIQDQLRGCVGHVDEDLPLCRVVGNMALQAAFGDHRFSPVSLEEFPRLEIEISALTPFTEIRKVGDIRVGTDGVMLKKGERKAVFLPEVPVTMGWDREMLLDELCLKAGLAPGSWRKGASLYCFQSTKFQESDFQ